MRLLIAEDDALHRTFLRTTATKVLPTLDGIEEVEDGADAIKRFDASEFEAIILDLQMPNVTGVDAAKYIWRKKPGTRILFWSNYAEEAYVRGITKIVPQTAVYGYVLKSSSEDRLQMAIQGVFLQDQCVIDREVRGVQQRADDRSEGLTELEYEALIDLSLGLTDRAMAARRNVSLRGAQSRLQHLYLKLGLTKADIPAGPWGPSYNTRTRAVTIAISRGLLNADAIRQEEEKLADWLARKTTHPR